MRLRAGDEGGSRHPTVDEKSTPTMYGWRRAAASGIPELTGNKPVRFAAAADAQAAGNRDDSLHGVSNYRQVICSKIPH